MAKKQSLRLRRAEKVFPNEVTRISPHDFMNIAIEKKKYLTKTEYDNLMRLADAHDNQFDGTSDILVKREGKRITLISM